jgi:DNA polymerase I-like protein with 3'-5' exonuclease and polymerase domains
MTSWSELPLTGEHAIYLRDQAAITAEVAEAAGIRSATTVEDLPEWARSWGEQAIPAIVFPWRSPRGEVVEQIRPDTPVVYNGEPHKYLWPGGVTSILNTGRALQDPDIVLIVEGTKQTHAAASWAPDGAAVYGIGGCRNWSTDGIALTDLDVCEDRPVVIALDADSATNLDVYTAGLRIADAVRAEGAVSVSFVRLPAAGSAGLDDVLAKRDASGRTAYLSRLIQQAKSKPADAKPKVKRTPRGASRPTGSDIARGMVYVDGDRLDVINAITGVLLERWNAVRLFSHGEILSQLTTSGPTPEMKPLTKGVFLDLLQETTATVKRAGDDGEAIVHTWPDGQTVDAVMSRSTRFAPLDRVARAPFVRPDGSVCQSNGYDEATGAMVVMDDVLTQISVPESPTDSETAMARKLLMDEWLGDFPFHSVADRANALALVLTPFVRGQVDKVPLAVVDGLQMGVGKNLFADCVNILATGGPAEPLPWTRDDEEVRKVITAAFRTGADIFVFDEAHHLDGAALARALTSATYKDRQLGASQMLGFPNRVTWISLGNQVRVEGDITRRVYRIALRPTAPDPHNRRAESFRHPDLLQWTTEHRADLLTAALTLVRAWFAAACPPPSRGVSFGSFERWERIVGGIVEHAGQPGFLDNLAEWRSETSFELRYWAQHITWLLEAFGAGVVFTCAQARTAMAQDPHSEPPPGLTDLTENPRDYNRKLGQAYARQTDRFFDGVQLVKGTDGRNLHGHVSGWKLILPTQGDEGITESATPGPVGGKGGNGGNPAPTRYEKKTTFTAAASPRDYSAAEPHVFSRIEEGSQVAPVAPLAPDAPSELDNSGIKSTLELRKPDISDTSPSTEGSWAAPLAPDEPDNAGIKATSEPCEPGHPTPLPSTAPQFPHVDPRVLGTQGAATPPEGAVALGIDIPSPPVALTAPGEPDNSGIKETLVLREPGLFEVPLTLVAPAASEFPRIDVRELDAQGAVTLPEGVVALDIETSSEEQLWTQGPEFIRLCGYQTGDRITITSDPGELARVIQGARLVIGHNVMAFDLVAFARHHGIDLLAMTAAGRVFDTKLAAILNDPPSPGSAQAQIQRDYSLDNLGSRLLDATKTGDLKALAKEHGGFDRIPLDDERYVRYLVGDVDLTARLAKQLKISDYVRREHRIAAIAAQIRMTGFRVDLPELQRRVTENREARSRHLASLVKRYGLPAMKKDGTPSKSPHATEEGKAAIIRAFVDLGVELPNTPKGRPSFGKVALAQVIEQYPDPDVAVLVDTVSSLNGVRTVFETVQQHLHGDRVHPEIGMFQASGRWSTTKPGLTVMGKRGGKHVEREVFLPEVGHVIISADLSQVDARAIAALSQDEAYLAMFVAGSDLHQEVAIRVWGDQSRREDAKALGHGWNYGMGVAGLARNAKVTEDVAREFDRGMREQFPRLVAWRDEIREMAQQGMMLDNGFGRRMRCDPHRSWTQAPALMGQGCARDLMMEGLLRLPPHILPMLRAVVHDEVVLSVPLDVIDDVEAEVLEALSFPWAPPGKERLVQIEAGLGQRRGINWGDVYRK